MDLKSQIYFCCFFCISYILDGLSDYHQEYIFLLSVFCNFIIENTDYYVFNFTCKHFFFIFRVGLSDYHREYL